MNDIFNKCVSKGSKFEIAIPLLGIVVMMVSFRVVLNFRERKGGRYFTGVVAS